MNSEYRIIEPITGGVIATKTQRGDESARNWLRGLLDRGTIQGCAVQLQRRTMTDAQAAQLPPFASGQAQTAWRTI